jgi:hypothetical protein
VISGPQYSVNYAFPMFSLFTWIVKSIDSSNQPNYKQKTYKNQATEQYIRHMSIYMKSIVSIYYMRRLSVPMNIYRYRSTGQLISKYMDTTSNMVFVKFTLFIEMRSFRDLIFCQFCSCKDVLSPLR